MTDSSRPDPEAWQQAVLAWGARHGRRGLPWQPVGGEADPYKVWLSEVMLQQTQVATVLPAFHRFLLRFPTLEALAAAPEEEVLGVWTGLGYYSRARNLHRTARHVAEQGWPNTPEGLAALPGVGRSTAAAIASVVWRRRAAILDGNVRRLLARVDAAAEPWNSPALARRLWPLAESLLPESDQMPLYTQTLMDLGASVCRPRIPACGECPVRALCRAYEQGAPSEFPVKATKRARSAVRILWRLPVERDPVSGRLMAVWLAQRPDSGIWAGLWTPLEVDGELAGVCAVIERGLIRHELTHRSLEIQWEAVAADCWGGEGVRWRIQDLVPDAGGWKVGLPRPVVEILQRFL